MVRKIEDFINERTTLILFGILAFSALLRLYHINFQSLWLDELYSIVPTAPENSLQSVIEYSKGDQPPLFFIYIHYMFKIFDYNEMVGRIAGAFIGLLSIPIIYLLGKECQSKLTGLFAALLTGVNYFHIYYSQELRFYAMTFLCATLSYLFYIRAYKRNRLIDYCGYAFFTISLLYTHYYGLIIFGTQALTFLILLIYKRDMKFVSLSITSAILIMLAFIPWLPTITNDLGVNLGWIKPPEPHFVAQYFYDYVGKDALSTLILVIFSYLFIGSMFKMPANDEQKPVFLIIIIWIILSYLVPYIRSIVVSPMLVNRYTIVTLPAWIIVFAIGWEQIKNLKWKYALSIILVLSAIINLVFFRQHYTRLKKDQFRESSEIVLLRNTSHHPIYSNLYWHFGFYFRNNAEKVEDLGTADLSAVEAFWLLQAHFSENEMKAEITRLSENFEVIERHYFFGSKALLMRRK